MIIYYILLSLILIIYLLNKNDCKTYVKQSKYGGRGVFANKHFNENEIIEEGYTIIDGELDCGIYRDYIYSRTDTNSNAFLLGNGSLYNHSYKNNNAYVRTINDKFIVYAKKNIEKDDEILVCYGCNHPNKNNHYDYGKSHKINLLD
jgi:SET domain-containing protein